jgi:hypothetical protein
MPNIHINSKTKKMIDELTAKERRTIVQELGLIVEQYYNQVIGNTESQDNTLDDDIPRFIFK